MADTVQTVIADAINSFSDLSQTKAVAYMNIIHKRLVHELGIRNTSKTVNMVDGTQEYAIGATVVEVLLVTYQKTATESWPLAHTSITELDLDEPTWRVDLTEGDPQRYYIVPRVATTTDAFYVGLLPIPDTTTSAGYPKLRIDYRDDTDFTVAGIATETIPGSIIESTVYSHGIRWQHATRMHPEKAEFYYTAFVEALERCREYLTGFVSNEPAMIRMNHWKGQSSI